MAETHRVIITGNNGAGKSAVVAQAHVGMTGPGNFDFWQTSPAARRTIFRLDARR